MSVEKAKVEEGISAGAIRLLRYHLGDSISQFARRLEVANSTVFYWEKGLRRPRGRNARRLSQLLEEHAAVGVALGLRPLPPGWGEVEPRSAEVEEGEKKQVCRTCTAPMAELETGTGIHYGDSICRVYHCLDCGSVAIADEEGFEHAEWSLPKLWQGGILNRDIGVIPPKCTMATYRVQCPDCKRHFEVLVKMQKDDKEVIELHKLIVTCHYCRQHFTVHLDHNTQKGG